MKVIILTQDETTMDISIDGVRFFPSPKLSPGAVLALQELYRRIWSVTENPEREKFAGELWPYIDHLNRELNFK